MMLSVLGKLKFVEESPALTAAAVEVLKAISIGLDKYKIEIEEEGTLGLERAKFLSEAILDYTRFAIEEAEKEER